MIVLLTLLRRIVSRRFTGTPDPTRFLSIPKDARALRIERDPAAFTSFLGPAVSVHAPPLHNILAKAMAKRPDSRYDSCTEFIKLITRALR